MNKWSLMEGRFGALKDRYVSVNSQKRRSGQLAVALEHSHEQSFRLGEILALTLDLVRPLRAMEEIVA